MKRKAVRPMLRLAVAAGALIASAGCALAARVESPSASAGVPSLADTIAAMPKNLPRAPGPALEPAIAAARAAVAACAARGVPVSVLIADTVGAPVVMLSGGGAGFRSQLIAQSKANIVAKFRMPSGDAAERAKTDPALAAQAQADPGIGVLRGGGLPVYRAGVLIGIVAVSGAGLVGDNTLDDTCAQAAITILRGE